MGVSSAYPHFSEFETIPVDLYRNSTDSHLFHLMPRLSLAVLIQEPLQIREVGLVDEVHQGPELFLDVLHRRPRHEHTVLVCMDARPIVHDLRSVTLSNKEQQQFLNIAMTHGRTGAVHDLFFKKKKKHILETRISDQDQKNSRMDHV